MAFILPRRALLIVTCWSAGCFTPETSTGLETDETGATGPMSTTSATNATSATTQTSVSAGSEGSSDDSGSGSGTTVAEATEAGVSVCGDGVVDGDEVCDDGVNDGSYGGCAVDCASLAPHCGDLRISDGETCDSGSENGDAGCNAFCQIPGTLLASLHDSIAIETGGAITYGHAATRWNGSMTGVFGGPTTTIWEVEEGEPDGARPTIQTLALRNLPDGRVWPAAGALGLADGNLLVVGGFAKTAMILDASLATQWTFESTEYAEDQEFVGVAPMAGGFFLGARHLNNSVATEMSAFWVVGRATSGAPLWESIEVVGGDHSRYARDFAGLGNDRAVLLTRGPDLDSPQFRIYDAVGEVVADQHLPNLAEVYRRLCVGENGFFLMNIVTLTLVGFDADGEPTFNAAAPPPSGSPATTEISCAARVDNSPVVALGNAVAGPGWLEITGFDGARPTWSLEVLDVPVSYDQGPVVVLDEAKGLAWIFVAGQDEPNVRGVHVVLVAI